MDDDGVPVINFLYELCAVVDPGDACAAPGFVMSEGQVYEATAGLMLCLKQPHAKAWRQAIARGRADIKLTASGREFGDGLWLVNKQIKPGTYVTSDVENCYWERQNRNGGVIANDFIIAAKRLQVTIRTSDYAFNSDGCGTWTPAK